MSHGSQDMQCRGGSKEAPRGVLVGGQGVSREQREVLWQAGEVCRHHHRLTLPPAGAQTTPPPPPLLLAARCQYHLAGTRVRWFIRSTIPENVSQRIDSDV
ncbi:hypothetical protein E2C01_074967 [Portunus trituberculatus]|uniref:Uncharacterized protein n=1 Tax=Portunus trituberculatus TaxID=210409 RepID=A0A5B7IEY1_PORTR|nr:hypothetical protein [Portunus trituberculatus]